MTKTEIKKRKNYVLKRISKFKTALHLDNYNGFIDFIDEESPQDFAAQISTNITYLTFEMDIFPSTLEVDDSALDRIILHELCHVIIEPLAAIARLSVSENTERDFYRALENAVEHTSRLLATKF